MVRFYFKFVWRNQISEIIFAQISRWTAKHEFFSCPLILLMIKLSKNSFSTETQIKSTIEVIKILLNIIS